MRTDRACAILSPSNLWLYAQSRHSFRISKKLSYSREMQIFLKILIPVHQEHQQRAYVIWRFRWNFLFTVFFYIYVFVLFAMNKPLSNDKKLFNSWVNYVSIVYYTMHSYRQKKPHTIVYARISTYELNQIFGWMTVKNCEIDKFVWSSIECMPFLIRRCWVFLFLRTYVPCDKNCNHCKQHWMFLASIVLNKLNESTTNSRYHQK